MDSHLTNRTYTQAEVDTMVNTARAETWHKAIEVSKKQQFRVAERPPAIYAAVRDVTLALEAAATAKEGE